MPTKIYKRRNHRMPGASTIVVRDEPTPVDAVEEPEDDVEASLDYSAMPTDELRVIAKEKGVKGSTRKSRARLLVALKG